jgi:putative endopeptidase
LQKALDKHPEERGKKIDGFIPEQRFFLSFAAIWRSKIRDEDQKLRLKTDPHSPAQYRVNGPLSDSPQFQKAFNIPDGSPMVRRADKRVNIW